MPVRILGMTIAGIYYMFPTSLPRYVSMLCTLRTYWWTWQHRGLATHGDDFGHGVLHGRWPSKSGFLNDPAAPSSLMLDQNLNGGGSYLYSPWIYGDGGCQSTKMIMGRCLNSVGSPVGGAVVKGFRTSDHLYVGQTVSDGLGYYELACPNTPNNAHFLTAYVDSSPDLGGRSVDTLIPTNRDGT